MFKQVFSEGNLTHFATWGLVIFVVVFACISVWALTRSRKTIHTWASLPLDDDPNNESDPPTPHAPSAKVQHD